MKILLLVLSMGLMVAPEMSSAAGPGGKCPTSPAMPGERVDLTLTHDGIARHYALHLPDDYNCSDRFPLVVGLHGYGGDGPGFEDDTAQMHEHLNAHDYIGVFPTALSVSVSNGTTSFNDLGSRNDFGPDGQTCSNRVTTYPSFENCGPEEDDRVCHWGTSCADDAGFLRAVIEAVKQGYSVDGTRIYLMGFSQGGQTAAGLACALQDKLAAVAPVHGFAANGYTCGPQSKVSLFQVWGTRDNWVRADGRASADGMIYDGADEAAAEWAEAQHCDKGPLPYPTESDGIKGWQCHTYAGCATEAEIVSCSWAGGHTWPRTRQAGNWGLDEVWRFLSAQSR